MQDNDFNLRDLVGILRRQAKIIWLCTALFVGAALIFAMTATPLYRAETLVLVNPVEQNVLNPTQQAALGSSLLNARVESEVEILESPTIALAVIRDANLIADPEFGPKLSTVERIMRALGMEANAQTFDEEALQGVVDRFMDARTVSRRGLTFVVSVSVESADPFRSAELSNALARSYIENQVDAKVANSLAARDVLQRQITVAQGRLAASEEDLNGFISDNLERLDNEAQSETLSALRAKLERIEAERESGADLSGLANEALKSRDWAALARQLKDESLARLATERSTLTAQLGNAGADDGRQSELRTALASLESYLENRSAEGVAELQDQVSRLDDEISQTQEDIRAALLRSDLSSQTLAEVFALQQSAELSRQQVQVLLSRLSELESQAAVQIADSRIVSEAMPPQDVSFPNLPVLLSLALVAGLSAGTGLALASEFYVGGVSSVSQLANVAAVPVAAEVPLQSEERGQASIADNIINKPVSAYSEALRHAVATISQRLNATASEPMATPGTYSNAHGIVILVTSSVPAEGKTTSALSLARTYAESGQSTLLIDADMRKPSLAEHLNHSSKTGLAEHLRRKLPKSPVEDFVTHDPQSTLGVILGGSRSTFPTDHLLASNRFHTMLESFRAQYDIVIIDSPPIIPVVDARYIVPHADVVLLVARYNSTPQGDIRQSMSLIKEAARPATEVFALLNQKDFGHDNRGYYSYYQNE
ncbi:MAG: polysaccharide biosynthesis tyrosine autokinase [Pseudomonadota bacterium]